MPNYTPIDYANAYFPTPILPKIIGQPTFEKLRALKKALKANSASVQSDLGGGVLCGSQLSLDIKLSGERVLTNTKKKLNKQTRTNYGSVDRWHISFKTN